MILNNKLLMEEGDIHQGGVFKDGEGGGSGDEERKNERRIAPK
jgi:hypothetical protein